MTIEQAKDRLRAMMPAGSRVNLEHTITHDDGPARRSERWRFSILMPGMGYWKNLYSFGDTFDECAAEAERHLAGYVRYRAARARRLARKGKPTADVRRVTMLRGSVHTLTVDGVRVTVAPRVVLEGEALPWWYDTDDDTAAVQLGGTIAETVANAFAAGMGAGAQRERQDGEGEEWKEAA
jgi:hypothetical protein